MRQSFLFILGFLVFSSFSNSSPIIEFQGYGAKEFLKFRVHYMGITAGFATLNVDEETMDNVPHYHVVGKGWTSGATKFFYKVNDRFETYINKYTNYPSKFVRKTNEGGYTKNKVLLFDQRNKRVEVENKKNNSVKEYHIPTYVQDMLSSFYYLRSLGQSAFKVGQVTKINIFMDEEIFPFQVKVLARESLNTEFGKIKVMKMRPLVQAGRVFKEEESLTFWVSDDDNLVPILVKANLAVGSLKAELVNYKNLDSPLSFY